MVRGWWFKRGQPRTKRVSDGEKKTRGRNRQNTARVKTSIGTRCTAARRKEPKGWRLCVERVRQAGEQRGDEQRGGRWWRLAPIARKSEDVDGVRNSIDAVEASVSAELRSRRDWMLKSGPTLKLVHLYGAVRLALADGSLELRKYRTLISTYIHTYIHTRAPRLLACLPDCLSVYLPLGHTYHHHR